MPSKVPQRQSDAKRIYNSKFSKWQRYEINDDGALLGDLDLVLPDLIQHDDLMVIECKHEGESDYTGRLFKMLKHARVHTVKLVESNGKIEVKNTAGKRKVLVESVAESLYLQAMYEVKPFLWWLSYRPDGKVKNVFHPKAILYDSEHPSRSLEFQARGQRLAEFLDVPFYRFTFDSADSKEIRIYFTDGTQSLLSTDEYELMLQRGYHA